MQLITHHFKLKNIKIVFLPANTISFCQPLDQGIMKNLKFLYKSLFLKDILLQMENTNFALKLSKSINLLDIVYFIQKACEQLSAETVRNCYRKADFRKKIAQLMMTVGPQKVSFHYQNFASSPISLNESRARFKLTLKIISI